MRLQRSIAFVFAAFFAHPSFACSCINTSTPVADVANHDAVFLGKVLASELVLVGKDNAMFGPSGPDLKEGDVYRITVVEVMERWTGDVPPFVILATGSGGGDCGVGFQPDESYLIYADRTLDKMFTTLAGMTPALTTSTCTFTSRARDASAALTQIREKYRSTFPVTVK